MSPLLYVDNDEVVVLFARLIVSIYTQTSQAAVQELETLSAIGKYFDSVLIGAPHCCCSVERRKWWSYQSGALQQQRRQRCW
jgi:hypothetical protein